MRVFFKTRLPTTPHHIFYFSGIVQLIIPLMFWLIELTGRYTSLFPPLKPNTPATWAHAFIMLYGFFCFFIFGFLISRLPDWINTKPIKKEQYLTAVTWLNLGLLILELSLFFNAPTIVSGCIVFLLGWLYSVAILYQAIKQAPIQHKLNPKIALLALISGALGIIGYSSWLYTGNWLAMQLSFDIGFWLYLMPIFFTLIVITTIHFSQTPNKTRPYLTIFLIACIGHFLFIQLPYPEWLFLTDLCLFTVTLLYLKHCILPCKIQKKLKIAIIMAFLWLGSGLMLSSVQSLWLLFTWQYLFNVTLFHTIYIGFFMSLVFISPAFLDLPIKKTTPILSNIQWRLFLGLQLVTITVLGAAIITSPIEYNHNLNLISAALCVLIGAIWIFYHFRTYPKISLEDKPLIKG